MQKIGAGAIPFVQLPGINGKIKKHQKVQSTVVVCIVISENFWKWLLKYTFKEGTRIPIFSDFY